MTLNIEMAIADSIREDRIIIEELRIDTQDWVDAVNGLAKEADDWVRISGGDGRLNDDVIEIREYWGVDDAWRIHIHSVIHSVR